MSASTILRSKKLALAISLSLSSYVLADSNGPTTQPTPSPGGENGIVQLPPVVVTATRTPQDPRTIGSSESVISDEEIEQKQAAQVSDVLRTVPSVDIVRAGGPAQQTSVFMRGSDSDHTLVLIDGIPANDPTSPAGSFDFSTLTTDGVDHIEVLRGPQSLLYGSNAIGGVINIITKKGAGPLNGYVYGEYGSYSTIKEGLHFDGGNSNVNYAFSVSHAQSEGFPAADERLGNHVNDGYGLSSFTGHVDWIVSSRFDIDFVGRYQNSQVGLDKGGGPPALYTGDENGRFLNQQMGFFRVAPHVVLIPDVYDATVAFNYTEYDRSDNDPTAPTDTHGYTMDVDFQNNIKLCKQDTVVFGADVKRENFKEEQDGFTPAIANKYLDTTSAYLEDQFNPFKPLFLTAGLRYETNSLSTDYTTYRFTGAYLFPTNSKLHSSYGTGFKQPTLTQLYSSYGSLALHPETSRGWDIGVEQGIIPNVFTVDATYFYNHFDDLIEYNYVTERLYNVDKSRAQGAELSSTLKATKDFTIRASYVYTDTVDFSTGADLLRRPRDVVSLDLDYRFLNNKADITLSGMYRGRTLDIDPVTYTDVKLSGYYLVNLYGSYAITDYLSVYGRIENLLNQKYEEVAGYGTPHASAYVGVRYSF